MSYLQLLGDPGHADVGQQLDILQHIAPTTTRSEPNTQINALIAGVAEKVGRKRPTAFASVFRNEEAKASAEQLLMQRSSWQ